jgi:hypothetical protein
LDIQSLRQEDHEASLGNTAKPYLEGREGGRQGKMDLKKAKNKIEGSGPEIHIMIEYIVQ